MRAKKRILLIDADENEISTLRLVLVTHGFNVLYACNAKTAAAEFPNVDLVIAVYAVPANADAIVRELKAISPWTPMVIVSDPAKVQGIHCADALINQKTIGSAELLERVRTWTARKRGPRKGASRVAPVTEAATA